MLDTCVLSHSITIWPELIGLLNAHPEETSGEHIEDAQAAPTDGVPETPEVEDQPVQRSGQVDSIWTQVSLRRDGNRPLQFRGALLSETEEMVRLSGPADQSYQATQTVRLFLTPDGAVVGQVICLPEAALMWRPVYRAEVVQSTDDVSRITISSAVACVEFGQPLRSKP